MSVARCYCALLASIHILLFHVGHASLKVGHHLFDHGVIPDAGPLPKVFEPLISLKVRSALSCASSIEYV